MNSDRRPWILLAIMLLLPAVSGCAPAEEVTESLAALVLAVVNGQLIDGNGGSPLANGVVVIWGHEIVTVGPSEQITIPEGATVLDAAGGTILPGLIDSHVHSTASRRVRREFAAAGITAVCDLGSPLADMAAFMDGNYQGQPVARGFRAGPIITANGGLPDAVLKEGLNYEIGSPEEGQAAVQDLADRGADMIKVYLQSRASPGAGRPAVEFPMLDVDTMQEVVEEAHDRGLMVRAHVTRLDALRVALETEVDVLEHVPIPQASPEVDARFAAGELSSDEVGASVMPQIEESFALFEQAAARGIMLTTTMERIVGDIYRAEDPPEIARRALELELITVGRYHEAGGPIALGTDFNVGVGEPGDMVLGELELLAAAGLTPMEVLEAGTHRAAMACGQGDRLGTLEPGKLADLIVVDGDPLADLEALGRVRFVVLDGEVAYGEQ